MNTGNYMFNAWAIAATIIQLVMLLRMHALIIHHGESKIELSMGWKFAMLGLVTVQATAINGILDVWLG